MDFFFLSKNIGCNNPELSRLDNQGKYNLKKTHLLLNDSTIATFATMVNELNATYHLGLHGN